MGFFISSLDVYLIYSEKGASILLYKISELDVLSISLLYIRADPQTFTVQPSLIQVGVKPVVSEHAQQLALQQLQVQQVQQQVLQVQQKLQQQAVTTATSVATSTATQAQQFYKLQDLHQQQLSLPQIQQQMEQQLQHLHKVSTVSSLSDASYFQKLDLKKNLS